MKILVINCGSSSFKYQLIDMATKRPLCSGLVERIGETTGKLIHKKFPDTAEEKKFSFELPFKDHYAGLTTVMDKLLTGETAIIKDLKEIAAVGHRVVHGGEALKKACLVTDEVKKIIKDLFTLSPLHNPANLMGIEVAEKLLPHAPSVAVFDTEFHSTMPPEAFMYALPYEFYEQHRVRRYGFHGTSHQYVSRKTAEFCGKAKDQFTMISCHLGNGCSIAAVKNGKCIDTSMGMTPLAGLMMGTRCGDIDPAIHAYLAKTTGMDIKAIDDTMNKKSGLKGICAMSDMRDIHSAIEKGDQKAKLALDMFCHSIRHYIGAYYLELGQIDALVFTAGIGENDEIVRANVCANLEHLGISIDLAVNDKRSGEPRKISDAKSKIPVLVVPTNEELEIAEQTLIVTKA
ncbi:acetate kinase [Desulfovibrio litoralis]|uniref:acetate kinase n=1 Tax=Desulfovibrio litoralis TaxID=466107 RepID=UPI0009331F23|nr:acetate kinase [Desulfovibrio litoralis]